MNRSIAFLTGLLFVVSPVLGATSETALKLLPEVVSAKSFIEELLARRYAQELTTLVDHQAFSLGTKLELVERPKVVKEDPKDMDEGALPPDLMLGTLDPENILKRYAGEDEKRWAEGFLKNYRISSVSISVGLKEGFDAEVKKQVETWLTERVNSEFGKIGKGSVSLIKAIHEKTPPPKSIWDLLSQFQGIAGQLVLALAILLGMLMWKFIVSRDVLARNEAVPPQAQATISTPAPPDLTAESLELADERAKKSAQRKLEMDETDRAKAIREVRQISKRLQALFPSMAAESEKIMRTWCRSGEDGWLKLACFAEAIGSTVGRLPVPMDSLEGLTKVFARMPELQATEKLAALRKVYWDVLATLNLGPEALEQPFGYLGQIGNHRVGDLLMAQNPKMKAIVTLFMPPKAREEYLAALDLEAKREVLTAAFQMSDVPSTEVKSFDQLLKGKVHLGAPASAAVPLRPMLTRLVDPLTPIEEITLLSGMVGDSILEFKRTYPSLAFIGEWPEPALSLLMSRATPEEVVALARVMPILKDRLLGNCPPITSKVAGDDLSRPDAQSEKEKNVLLGSLKVRVKEMAQTQEVNLETIFPKTSIQGTAPSDVLSNQPKAA